MSHARHAYLPAAGRDFLLPLYDPLTKLLGADRARRKLFDQASVQPDHRILDIGCGTGTFAVAIKRWLPTVTVVGIDPDPKALARSHRKAMAAGVSIRFDQAFANALPYADSSFDRVFSSLMFHHLPQDTKLATLCEVRRVLRPGATLHLLDFVEPGRRSHNPVARWLHTSQPMQENTQERILSWMSEAGLLDPLPVAFDDRLFGRIVYYRASAPFTTTSAEPS